MSLAPSWASLTNGDARLTHRHAYYALAIYTHSNEFQDAAFYGIEAGVTDSSQTSPLKASVQLNLYVPKNKLPDTCRNLTHTVDGKASPDYSQLLASAIANQAMALPWGENHPRWNTVPSLVHSNPSNTLASVAASEIASEIASTVGSPNSPQTPQ